MAPCSFACITFKLRSTFFLQLSDTHSAHLCTSVQEQSNLRNSRFDAISLNLNRADWWQPPFGALGVLKLAGPDRVQFFVILKTALDAHLR